MNPYVVVLLSSALVGTIARSPCCFDVLAVVLGENQRLVLAPSFGSSIKTINGTVDLEVTAALTFARRLCPYY